MILAAPLVIPFAEIIGVSIAALGMSKATDEVNKYIEANPEKSMKIFQMIMPSQGIANALKNKSSDEEVEEDVEVEEVDTRDLTKKEKAKEMKRRFKEGTGDKREIGKKGYEEIILPGKEDEMLDDAEDRYDGGVEDAPKPKFDYKKFFKKRYADGGAIGIEVLFGPKVPAAPSQLVSESDILLGYRGDAAYRSGSEQSKSIGQGNVGSKASFGGGQGRDRSGRSEGAGGAQVSRALEAQRLQNIANQNKSNSTIDTMKNVYGIVSPFVNPGSNLGKVKNIFDVYNLYKNRSFTEEDMTLGMGDNPLPSENLLADATTTPTGGKLGLNLMDYGTLKDSGYSDGQIEELQNNPNINTEEVIRDIKGPIFAAADGGRVGLFMGGDPLTGQALSIYNSMNAYGFDDQAIANALQEQGLYDPNASTPDTTPDTGQTIGYQGGDGAPASLFGKNLNPTFSKDLSEDPRFNYLEPTAQANKYRFDRSVEPREGLMGFFDKVGNKFKESKFFQPRIKGTLGDRRLKAYNNPMLPSIFGALGRKFSPFNPQSATYNAALPMQLNFLEMGQVGDKSGLNLIGRNEGSGLLQYGADSVLSGKNVISGFGTNDYETALRNFISRMNANTRISDTRKTARLAAAQAELDALMAKQAQEYIDSGKKAEVAALQKEIDSGKYSGGSDFAQSNQAAVGGGNTATNAQGQTASQATSAGTGTSQGYSQHYARGGLVTMFKEKR